MSRRSHNSRPRFIAASAALAIIAVPGGPSLGADANSLLIVDCLLPVKIQRLGTAATYVAQRRAIKTTAIDCRLRGGEYTEPGAATYATLVRVWLPLAQGGDAEAQANVGEIFERGIGGSPQPDLAARWYQLAAEKGHARAQVNLGSLYERGIGVPRNPAKAAELYRRASGLDEAGFSGAPNEETSRLREERDRLYKDLKSERDRREQLERELNSTRERLEGQRSSVFDQERELEAARKDLIARSTALASEKARDKLESGERDRSPGEIMRLQKELEQQRASLAERDSHLGTLRLSLKQLEARASLLETQLTAAREQGSSELATARKEASLAKRELAAATARLNQANDELQSRLTTIAEQRAAVAQLTRRLAEVRNDASITRPAVAELETRLRAREAELEESRTKLSSLSAEIQKLQAASLSTSPRSSAVSHLPGTTAPTMNVDFGRYYALVIGSNNYQFMPKLRTAVGDARAVSELLSKRYGFKTSILIDPDRYQLLSALNKLRETLTEKDNLLIYYAGHGALDETNERGYWLPIDAEADSTANWIASYQITDILRAMSAKQVMLVADSCYQGMLTRSAITKLASGMSDEERRRWYQTMTTKHARVVLTSGGVQPVLDGGGGQHSVFASAFLRALEENREVLEGQKLAQDVTKRVAVSAAAAEVDQLPMYAPISFAGHEAGDFFFVPS